MSILDAGAVLLVDAGLLAAAIGFVAIIRPIRRLGIPTRHRAVAVFVTGVLMIVIGGILPARVVTVSSRTMLLDDFVPRYQFNEVHSVEVHAPPDAVFAAIRQVTAREIGLFRALTWIRSPRLRSSRESILAAPPDEPIVGVAKRSGFLMLAEAPPRELVFGTVGFGAPLVITHPTPADFLRFDRPGYAKIAMNFTIAPRADGWSTLRTETRVFGTDDAAKRRFGAYWRVIYPGSAIIRVMWLRAIRARAERVTGRG